MGQMSFYVTYLLSFSFRNILLVYLLIDCVLVNLFLMSKFSRFCLSCPRLSCDQTSLWANSLSFFLCCLINSNFHFLFLPYYLVSYLNFNTQIILSQFYQLISFLFLILSRTNSLQYFLQYFDFLLKTQVSLPQCLHAMIIS